MGKAWGDGVNVSMLFLVQDEAGRTICAHCCCFGMVILGAFLGR